MTVEVISPLADVQEQSGHRQTTMPSSVTGSFQDTGTTNHDFKVDARGKGRMVVCVNNASDKLATVTVYGMHSKTADVGDAGVVELGQAAGDSQFTVDGAAINYEAYNDPFPFFLIRVALATGSNNGLVTVYVDLQQQ